MDYGKIMCPEGLRLVFEDDSLYLTDGEVRMRGDFSSMTDRIRYNNLTHELLVKAAKIKDCEGQLTVLDATAGMGEDSLLLAAAGYRVIMYEYNEVIAALLEDSLRRAAADPQLEEIAARMETVHGDSIAAMREGKIQPDIVFLDPMFPKRKKSGLIKKKFQLIQQLEYPCSDEKELLEAAIAAKPRRIIIKRPLKGPYLAGLKPDYSLPGKAIRYDCLTMMRSYVLHCDGIFKNKGENDAE